MQGIAIVTKFLGPTNKLSARVKAFLPSGKAVTLPWNLSLSIDENHGVAAIRVYSSHILDESNRELSHINVNQIYGIANYPAGFVAIVSHSTSIV